MKEQKPCTEPIMYCMYMYKNTHTHMPRTIDHPMHCAIRPSPSLPAGPHGLIAALSNPAIVS